MLWKKRGQSAGTPVPTTNAALQEQPEVIIDLTPKVPSLPKFPDKTLINVRYTLIAPYVSAHIYWNEKVGEVVYEIEEPLLNDFEKKGHNITCIEENDDCLPIEWEVETKSNTDGFAVTDFVPTPEVIGGLILYVINTLLDLLRKYIANGSK